MNRPLAPSKKSGADEVLIVKNRRASFDYEIKEVYQGGLVLLGSEIKSLRAGRVELVDAFASIDRGEVWLKQLNIEPLATANAYPHMTRRVRKVLLHTREIRQIERTIARQGLTLIPLRLYLLRGIAKIELALVKGKKIHDKRATIAKKTADREVKRVIDRANKVGR